jgi:hypothetical protein
VETGKGKTAAIEAFTGYLQPTLQITGDGRNCALISIQ